LSPRTAVVLVALAVALGASVVLATMFGAVPLVAADVFGSFFGDTDRTTGIIVRDIRFPRVIAAALVGAALAAAGALLQGLLRNPLADPYVTGTSAGGALGAVVAVTIGAYGAWIPLLAFVGALGSVALVWQLARLGGRTTVLTVLLAGVVLSSFAGAAVSFVLVATDRLGLRVRSVLDVLVGSVTSRALPDLAAAAAIIGLGLAIALLIAPRIDAYAFGEEQAAALGVDTERTTLIALTATALLAGAAVALAGLVGFVGLVIPHALRAVVGAAHRRLVATSALAGATALVVADAGARIVVAPTELPVGVITGLVGAPFFLLLLYRSRRTVIV